MSRVPVDGDPHNGKNCKNMGWTGHDLLYFLFDFFLLYGIFLGNMIDCFVGNIANLSCGHFCVLAAKYKKCGFFLLKLTVGDVDRKYIYYILYVFLYRHTPTFTHV